MAKTLDQLRQSVAFLQQGNLAEAMRLSQAILRAEPGNFDAHHIMALASYHARDIDTAGRHIARALAIRSDMPDAFNTQGLIRRAQGRLAEGAEAFARAAKLNPRSREAHYNLANALQDMGRLAAALEHYDAALRVEPGMAMAWNNRGLALRRMGRAQEALSSFDEAIRLGPGFAPAHYNKADGLAALQQPEAAIAAYDRAIALQPGFAEAHCNRANALMVLGRHDEALAGYDRAIALQPGFAEAQVSRGIALSAAGRQAEAEESFRSAIALRPDYADAHYNLGKLLKEAGRLAEAVAAYDEAIRLRPEHAESHSNRGNALTELKRLDEAMASIDRAIALRPDFAEAHTNRGNALTALERYEEAAASHREALRLRPGWAEPHNNLGNVLMELNRLPEALAALDAAIALKPDHAMAYSNRGNALRELNRPAEAMASFDAALALTPDAPSVRYSKSVLVLQQHRFREGFALQRARWGAEDFEGFLPETGIPVWDGAPVGGEVLLWGEQGLGDEVFYASMLSLIDPAAQPLAVSCDRRLHPAYRRSFPGIRLLDRKTTEKTITGDFAAQAGIGDIGDLLAVDAARIAARRYPYLIVDDERRRQIAASAPFAGGGPVCGISWRSGNRKLGPSRSLRLTDLAPILKVPGLSFVNLQYGDVAQDIHAARQQLGSDVQLAEGVDVFGDVDGLLALIAACDVVLTTDNVTAHLAGALGKKSVVLVPTGRGRYWYWGGEARSLWYPSLRLVYQEAVGDWTGAIADAARQLAGLIQED